MKDPLRLTAELTPSEAHALAQFIKRMRFDIARQLAASDDEAYLTMASIDRLRKALAEEGIDPR